MNQHSVSKIFLMKKTKKIRHRTNSTQKFSTQAQLATQNNSTQLFSTQQNSTPIFTTRKFPTQIFHYSTTP